MTFAKISDFLTHSLSANSCNLPYIGCLLCLLVKVLPSPPQWGRPKWKPPIAERTQASRVFVSSLMRLQPILSDVPLSFINRMRRSILVESETTIGTTF